MGIKGKTIVKTIAGIGSVLAAGAGLLLAKKSGELTEDKDMLKLDPLGEDDTTEDDIFCEEQSEIDQEEVTVE